MVVHEPELPLMYAVQPEGIAAVAPQSLDEWDTSGWDDDDDGEDRPADGPGSGAGGVVVGRDPHVNPDASIRELVSEEEEFASPEERAQARFNRLSTAFSATLVIVGQMYRDEDWRYLRKDDGSEYKSLVEVCQVAMGKSVAMARRYVQGARDFYLPLSAVMVQGTRLEITSGDIASLGTDGIKGVVDEASERLDGVDDPDEATGIVNDTLENARAEREQGRREAEDSGEGWDDASSREFYEDPESDASGPVYSFEGDDDDGPGVTAPGAEGSASGGGSYFVGEDDDLIGPLLDGAQLFTEDAELDRLPIPVKRVVRAMLTLADADISEVAQALGYENRGIIVHSDQAQKALARIRSVAETQPWVMKQLGHTD